MTIAAVLLFVVGMAAALGRPRRSPLHTIHLTRTVGTVGVGAIMLGAMSVPGWSRLAVAALTAGLLLLVLAGTLALRLRRGQPLESGQRTVAALTVVDLGFMAAAVLLLPIHGSGHGAVDRAAQQLTSAASGIHAGSHSLAGGVMIWLVLLAWASCAAVLIAPMIRWRPREGVVDVVCSGSMIAAMAAMAVSAATGLL